MCISSSNSSAPKKFTKFPVIKKKRQALQLRLFFVFLLPLKCPSFSQSQWQKVINVHVLHRWGKVGIYEIIRGSHWVTVLSTKMAITAKTVNFFNIYPKYTIQSPLPPNFSLSVTDEFLQLLRISKKLLGKGKWNDLCLSCQILRLLKPVWIGTFNTSSLHLKLATSCPLCSWASTNCVLPEKKTCQVLLQVRRMWPQNQCLQGTDHNLESVSDTSQKHIPCSFTSRATPASIEEMAK